MKLIDLASNQRRATDDEPAMAALRDRLARHRDLTLLLGAFGTIAVGVVDWATGPELAFSVFYLIPLAAVAWASSGAGAYVLSGLAAVTWLSADIAAGQQYSSSFIPVWNMATRLACFLIVVSLLSQLHRAIEHERAVARVDYLTGVYNSRWFERAATRAVDAMANTTNQLTFMYLDLDDFKSVNERHGHSGGDDVLRKVGQALRSGVRSDDIVARVGGDEFVLLLFQPAGANAQANVDAIVARVDRALGRMDPPVSFSAGAVTFTTPPASIDAAIDAADRLMFEVKRSGKGSLVHSASV